MDVTFINNNNNKGNIMHTSIYDMSLEQNHANYSALTPLEFLQRSAEVYPDYLAQIHHEQQFTWKETYDRVRALASALQARGAGIGTTISFICPNIKELFEAHFAIPMIGAVLNPINTRLDAQNVSFILEHAETDILFVDRQFSELAQTACHMIDHPPKLIIDIDDPFYSGGKFIGELTYDALLEEGDSNFAWTAPKDEWQAISLSYTSGTTGNPKGVVYHHRGAALNAVGNMMSFNSGMHPRYLWVLPMFHCDGWCFPWTIAAYAGVSISLRQVDPEDIFNSIKNHGADHFCAAPTVLSMLINADAKIQCELPHKVKVMTAGAAPPAAIIEKTENLGFDITHVYGLTETYGPCMVCAWHDKWNALPLEQRAKLKARQGVRYSLQSEVMVANPKTMQPVPQDGTTIGEIMIRGNIVMKGYLKNPRTTEEAFSGGYFHSGDLAVIHPDGYVEIKDRSKDIIISGGENISSIEVEDVLYRHHLVNEVAVVAKPDDHWGEVPCAFVSVKADASLTEEELKAFCLDHLAKYKIPKNIYFQELPKTSTGKIQKFMLRDSLLNQ